MAETCDVSNLNSIKEMVLDEERLVTYVSICKELCLHVNQSKTLLHAFVEDIKKKQPDTKLNVCYILSGLTDDKKGRTTVCSEVDLDTVKATFKTLFFNHIYSVSKGLPSVDDVALLAVNKFDDFPLCTGLIKNTSCGKRSSEEISKLKSSSQEVVQVELKVTAPLKKVKTESKTDLRNGHVDAKPVSKPQESKSEPALKTEQTSPKKEPPSSKPVDNKKNGVKAQKGIAGFFSKANSDPGKKTSKEVIDNKPKDEKVVLNGDPEKKPSKEVNPKKVIDNGEHSVKTKMKVENMEVDEEVDIVKVDKVIKKEKGKAKPKNKTITQIKKNAKVDKKRKRVLKVSDSESEDEKDPFMDDTPEPQLHESDDEIPPTPANNIVKITSGIVNPRKRRKIVDKTYTDEDGYILTKKEEVYESCSDNEDVEMKENNQVQKNPVKTEVKIVTKMEISPKAKKNASKSKKKVSPPEKGKQSTMMNFFKKV